MQSDMTNTATSATLATKLHVPPLRAEAVARERLIQRVEDGVRDGRALTLISAPAGFGKTTLISAWLQASGRAAAWFSLDDGDNDPIRFWRYVIAALQTRATSIGSSASTMLAAPQTPLESLAAALLNDLIEIDQSLVLVIDDYHTITDPNIHTSLDFFLDRLPLSVHVVIATREDPPLSLPRRRARQKLAEVRAADLRFTLAETADLLNTHLQLGLSANDLAALEQRTEGWAVGLQLAALSLQGRSDKHDFVSAFAGDDRYIADYLIEEVIQRQPPHVQDFLLKTSILPRLNAGLCDALLDRHDSRSVLLDLERANLFVVPLDNRREWFRYHRLFADLLQQRLSEAIEPMALIDLHRRAGEWFEGKELMNEAIEQALIARDYDTAARRLRPHVQWLFFHSELQTLADYVAAFPADYLAQHLPLLAMRSWALLASGQSAKALRCIETIENNAHVASDDFDRWAELSADTRAALIETGVMRMRLVIDRGDVERTLWLAQQILPHLNEGQQQWLYNFSYALRAPVLFMQALAHELHGEVRTAEIGFHAAADQDQDNPHIVAQALGHLGQVQALQGQLRAATETFQHAIQLSEELGAYTTPFFGISQAGYGNVLYELNDLDEAEHVLQAAIKQGQAWHSWEVLIPAFTGLTRVKQAQGDWPAARAALDDLLAASQHFIQSTQPLVNTWRAWLALRQGQLDAAQRWAQALALTTNSEVTYSNESDLIIFARLLIAQGQFNAADRLIDRLLTSIQNGGRGQRTIEVWVLRAVVLEALKQSAEALKALSHALDLAKPEGYVRVFVEAGPSVARLLLQKMKDAPENLKQYIGDILAAISPETVVRVATPAAPLTQSPLIEPLSDREVEVLQLIDQGLSNPEIAAKLVLSTGTVKVHTHNIFSKLAVTSRTQAVNKARALGLI